MPNYRDREDAGWKFSKEHQESLKKWISEKFSTETINYAEKFGEYLVKNRLTSSQMRVIYGEVKRIEASVMTMNAPKDEEETQQVEGDLRRNVKDFLLLRPKLAYAAKRSGTRGIEDLKKVMDVAHGAVHLEEVAAFQNSIENFADFFEAILAYHKAYGGRE